MPSDWLSAAPTSLSEQSKKRDNKIRSLATNANREAMPSKPEIISLLTNPGIIAVVRAQKPEQVVPLSEALIAGGVIAVEITMTTPNAIEAIRAARQKIGDRGLIGVGTVL